MHSEDLRYSTAYVGDILDLVSQQANDDSLLEIICSRPTYIRDTNKYTDEGYSPELVEKRNEVIEAFTEYIKGVFKRCTGEDADKYIWWWLKITIARRRFMSS